MKKLAALLALIIICTDYTGAEDVEVKLNVQKPGLPSLTLFVFDQEKNSLTAVKTLEKGKEFTLYVGGSETPRAFTAKGPSWKGGAQKVKIDGPLTIEIDELEIPWNATVVEKDDKTYVIWLEQPDPTTGGSIVYWKKLGLEGYANDWLSGDKTQVRRNHLSVFPITDDKEIVVQGLQQLRNNKYPSPTIGDVIDQK